MTRWRHKELDGWAALLERKAEQTRARARRMWFPLHDMLTAYRRVNQSFPPWYTRVSQELETIDDDDVDADNDDNDKNNAKKSVVESKLPADLHQTLDDFIRTCSMGEFPTRLRLLKGFYFSKKNEKKKV